MGVVKWFCRCIPGLSVLLWIAVTYLALGGRLGAKSMPTDWNRLTPWQIVYILYSVIAHLFACLLFPIRLCWALWHISDEIKSAKFEAFEGQPHAESEGDTDDKSSQLSLSGKTLSVSDGPLSRAGTPKGSSFPEMEDVVVHAIILPSYKEDMDTMRQTLAVLASHVLAKKCYDVSWARNPQVEPAV